MSTPNPTLADDTCGAMCCRFLAFKQQPSPPAAPANETKEPTPLAAAADDAPLDDSFQPATPLINEDDAPQGNDSAVVTNDAPFVNVESPKRDLPTNLEPASEWMLVDIATLQRVDVLVDIAMQQRVDVPPPEAQAADGSNSTNKRPPTPRPSDDDVPQLKRYCTTALEQE